LRVRGAILWKLSDCGACCAAAMRVMARTSPRAARTASMETSELRTGQVFLCLSISGCEPYQKYLLRTLILVRAIACKVPPATLHRTTTRVPKILKRVVYGAVWEALRGCLWRVGATLRGRRPRAIAAVSELTNPPKFLMPIADPLPIGSVENPLRARAAGSGLDSAVLPAR
jgi:hypothetical protein